jgi:hypothetical protein
MTARLAELAAKSDSSDATMMSIIAADHARDLPGVTIARGRFELAKWREEALRLLTELEPKDEATRKEAAVYWAGRLRAPQHLLFGAPELIEGNLAAPAAGRRA